MDCVALRVSCTEQHFKLSTVKLNVTGERFWVEQNASSPCPFPAPLPSLAPLKPGPLPYSC